MQIGALKSLKNIATVTLLSRFFLSNIHSFNTIFYHKSKGSDWADEHRCHYILHMYSSQSSRKFLKKFSRQLDGDSFENNNNI
jgi:hypothetical protein